MYQINITSDELTILKGALAFWKLRNFGEGGSRSREVRTMLGELHNTIRDKLNSVQPASIAVERAADLVAKGSIWQSPDRE